MPKYIKRSAGKKMEAELVAWIILIVATAIGVVAVYSDNSLLFFIALMLIFKILKCEKKAKNQETYI